MNKKGFTLIEVLAVIVVMALVLMLVFPSLYKIQNSNSEKKYQTYEDMMVEYAKVSKYNNQSIITLNNLDELQDVKKECSGYVTITGNIYKAYISCGNKYETDGYEEGKAN